LAKLVTGVDGVTHLRHSNGGCLCGSSQKLDSGETEGTLTCPECAKVALHAVELVTKAEKREWRQL
jgi:hypothetical protein